MTYQFRMVQPGTGRTAIAHEGVSWTTLFFGPWPAFMRGHMGGGAIIFLAYVGTLSLSNWVFFFTYNRWHRTYLSNDGFVKEGEATSLSKLDYNQEAEPRMKSAEEAMQRLIDQRANGDVPAAVKQAATPLRPAVQRIAPRGALAGGGKSNGFGRRSG